MKDRVVCHLSNFAPEYPGSFIDSLLQLAICCREQELIHTVCIFPEEARKRSWIRRFDAEGVDYGFVPRTRNVVGGVRSVLREYNPVILHTHFFLYDLCSVLLKLLFYRKTKVIWHYHNPTTSALPQRFKLQVIGRFLGDACIAVGNDVYRSLIEAGLPTGKAVLIHNGINIARFSPNENARKCAREFLGVSKDDTVFLLLGLDPFRKGVDTFVQAASELASRGDSAHSVFLIVGRQNARDFVLSIPYRPAPGSSVRIIDPLEDFPSILNGIDVLVSCSRREAFGYAVAEAMALRKLIVCSAAPGMREIYDKAPGIWFFPTEDWKTLAELMKQVGNLEPTQRECLGGMNYRYIKERYSVEAWAANMMKAYGSVLQG